MRSRASTPRPPGWRAAAVFFLLLALTPNIPYLQSASLGVALNDFPPILAVGFGLYAVAVRHRRGWSVKASAVAVVTAEIALLAGASAAAAGLDVKDVLGGPVRWTETTLIIALAFALGSDRDQRSLLLRAATVFAAADALFGIAAFVTGFSVGAHYIGIEPFRAYDSLFGVFPGRIDGTLGLPASGAGALFALALPLAAAYAIGAGADRQARIRWSFAAMTLAVALLFTFDRVSTALGFGLVVVLFGLRLRPQVALTVGGTMLLLVLGSPIRDRFTKDSNDRLALWTAAIKMIRANLWFGVGPTKYEDALPLYRNTPFGVAGTTAHNSVLEAAATLGLLAGVLLVVAIVISLWWLPSALRLRAVAPEVLAGWLALTGFALTSLTVNFFFWPQLGLLYWTTALALSRVRGEPDARRPPRTRSTPAPIMDSAARRALVTSSSTSPP
ncbi:MAG: O-antigen ligase family protein [Pseudonocardiales bacterium]